MPPDFLYTQFKYIYAYQHIRFVASYLSRAREVLYKNIDLPRSAHDAKFLHGVQWIAIPCSADSFVSRKWIKRHRFSRFHLYVSHLYSIRGEIARKSTFVRNEFTKCQLSTHANQSCHPLLFALFLPVAWASSSANRLDGAHRTEKKERDGE